MSLCRYRDWYVEFGIWPQSLYSATPTVVPNRYHGEPNRKILTRIHNYQIDSFSVTQSRTSKHSSHRIACITYWNGELKCLKLKCLKHILYFWTAIYIDNEALRSKVQEFRKNWGSVLPCVPMWGLSSWAHTTTWNPSFTLYPQIKHIYLS
jgi:hypothetical protein